MHPPLPFSSSKQSHSPQRKPAPIMELLPPPNQFLETTDLLFLSIELPFLDIAYKWNHSICDFSCLASPIPFTGWLHHSLSCFVLFCFSLKNLTALDLNCIRVQRWTPYNWLVLIHFRNTDGILTLCKTRANCCGGYHKKSTS